MTHHILHHATTYDCEGLLNSVVDAKKALLDVLIDMEFKDCVAHANVQSYLSDLWMGKIESILRMLKLLHLVRCWNL